MATQKRAEKKKAANGKRPKGKLDIGSDPPIIVGGGGSTYIWIRLDQLATVVDPTVDNAVTGIKPGAATPHTRSNYMCLRVRHIHARVVINNGIDPEAASPIRDDRVCHIRFE